MFQYFLQIKIISLKNFNIKNLIIINKKKKKNISFFKNKKKKKIYTVLKSPHVNKKSREHFLLNQNYKYNFIIKFKNIFKLLNYIIFFKKKNSNNNILKFKIIKKCL